MSLDERDYMNEQNPYNLPEHETERRLREIRNRFEAVTPRTSRSKWRLIFLIAAGLVAFVAALVWFVRFIS